MQQPYPNAAVVRPEGDTVPVVLAGAVAANVRRVTVSTPVSTVPVAGVPQQEAVVVEHTSAAIAKKELQDAPVVGRKMFFRDSLSRPITLSD